MALARTDAPRTAVVLIALAVILLAALLLASAFGPYPLAPGDVALAIATRLFGAAPPGPIDTILF